MLVGTTFAWFHSSATSAVSTITASSNFSNLAGARCLSREAIALACAGSVSPLALCADGDDEAALDAVAYPDISELPWIPFAANGGSPFSSIPFTSGVSQVIFLRLENPGSSDIRYRFALNLLSEAPGKTADGQEVFVSEKLVYGCEVLDTADLLELAYFDPADRADPDTKTTNFVTDSLSEHSGTRSEDGNIISFGGYVGEVFLAANSGAKYVAIALYMPEDVVLPDFVAQPTIAVQLAMTVEQASTTEPQQPNVVISPISNSTVVEIKQAIIGQPSENEVSKDSAEEAKKEPVDGTKTGEETNDNGTTDQPATGTQTPPETPPSSTGESGTPSGASDTGTTSDTSDTDTSGGAETHVSEPQAEVPTT